MIAGPRVSGLGTPPIRSSSENGSPCVYHAVGNGVMPFCVELTGTIATSVQLATGTAPVHIVGVPPPAVVATRLSAATKNDRLKKRSFAAFRLPNRVGPAATSSVG